MAGTCINNNTEAVSRASNRRVGREKSFACLFVVWEVTTA